MKTFLKIGSMLVILLFIAFAVFIMREIMLYYKTGDLHHGINASLALLAYLLFRK